MLVQDQVDISWHWLGVAAAAAAFSAALPFQAQCDPNHQARMLQTQGTAHCRFALSTKSSTLLCAPRGVLLAGCLVSDKQCCHQDLAGSG